MSTQSMKPSGAPSQWQPTIPVDQSIYEDSTTQKAPLGTRLEVGNRVFYYAQAAASQPRGVILCAATPVGSHNGALATFAAAVQDTNKVTLTLGNAAAVNAYAEGYLGISKGTMGGATYRIKTNAVVSSAGAGVFTLYDAIYDDVGAADEAGLTQNPYASLILGSEVLGVPVCMPMIDVTSAGYFWGLTYGPASPLNVAATPVANVLRLGTTGGVNAAFDATTNAGIAATAKPIGQNLSLAGTAGEYTPVLLDIRQ